MPANRWSGHTLGWCCNQSAAMRAAGLAIANPTTARTGDLAANNGGPRDVVPHTLASGLNEDEDCADDANKARHPPKNNLAKQFSQQHLLHSGGRSGLQVDYVQTQHLFCRRRGLAPQHNAPDQPTDSTGNNGEKNV
jgi:hypothetical protein